MTTNELLITAGIFVLIVLAYWFALGLCRAASNPTPHPDEVNSCNGGLTDEEMFQKKYDLLKCPKCGYVMPKIEWESLVCDVGCPVCHESLTSFHEVKEGE